MQTGYFCSDNNPRAGEEFREIGRRHCLRRESGLILAEAVSRSYRVINKD